LVKGRTRGLTNDAMKKMIVTQTSVPQEKKNPILQRRRKDRRITKEFAGKSRLREKKKERTVGFG